MQELLQWTAAAKMPALRDGPLSKEEGKGGRVAAGVSPQWSWNEDLLVADEHRDGGGDRDHVQDAARGVAYWNACRNGFCGATRVAL